MKIKECETIITEIKKWENLLPNLYGTIGIELEYQNGELKMIDVFPKKEKVKI